MNHSKEKKVSECVIQNAMIPFYKKTGKFSKVIFDLDQTLIESSPLEELRRQRRWAEVYANIEKCDLYNGMTDVFSKIKESNIIISIVSSAPKSYIERMVNFFNIPCNYIVGYHDVTRQKPYPDPFFRAMQLMKTDSSATISFGDKTSDITASKSARIFSVGCLWGSKEPEKLSLSHCDFLIKQPDEILSFLDLK